MEQNKEPRNKSTLYSQYLKEEASTYNGLKIVYLINDVWEIGQVHTEK